MADETQKETRGEPQERMESEGVEPNAEAPEAEGKGDTGTDKQQQSQDGKEPAAGGGGEQDDDDMSAAEKAQKSEEEREQAREKMDELEKEGAPDKLEDWPDDAAKYETFGGPEGTHSYHEGPEEEQLGPSSLRHHEGGGVTIEGEEVDNPDEYKAEPIPGGPTDENSPDISGEDKEDGDSDKDDGDSDEESESKEESEAAS